MKYNQTAKQRRAIRVRHKIQGTAARPRLSVFRSLKHISAQLIDDEKGVTLLAVGDLHLKVLKGKKKTEVARLVGEEVAQKAKTKKITKVIFDRGPYAYFGRVKALAEGAREKGLQF
ncbi:50S ribosomal protein L18 [Patescibacteria group bacterium]|nr:50S ribosomal protein L18 [Patescibacteria group bacterium]